MKLERPDFLAKVRIRRGFAVPSVEEAAVGFRRLAEVEKVRAAEREDVEGRERSRVVRVSRDAILRASARRP